MSRPDAVTISLPGATYTPVARLVAGGFVARLGLGFEAIDDLQLALELVLRARPFAGRRAVVSLASDADGITVVFSGFRDGSLDRLLAEVAGEGIELGRLLARLVDSADVGEETLTLRKAYEATLS